VSYRCRCHDQNIDRLSLGGEGQALMHAEAMLFIDDGDSQILVGDIVLKQSMGADGQPGRAGIQLFQNPVAFFTAFATGQQ